jgi:hypothetical protein
LADRFFCANFDLDAINCKTLAATPYVVLPSYAQVVHAGMSVLAVMVAVPGGEVSQLVTEEGAQVAGKALAPDRATTPGSASTTTMMARASTDPTSIPTWGLIR